MGSSEMVDNASPVWTPTAPELTAMADFGHSVAPELWEAEGSVGLHRFSIEDPGRFWAALWEWAPVIGDRGARLISDSGRLDEVRFCPDATLNFAENLLRRDDDTPAMLSWDETGQGPTLTWRRLNDRVRRLGSALSDLGITQGDRIAAWMPNIIDTYVVMLATTSIGAVFTSTSPDFGVDGVIDRFGQTRPRILFAADGYRYKGSDHDCLTKLDEIVSGLDSIEQVVLVSHLAATDPAGTPNSWQCADGRPTIGLAELEATGSAQRCEFERFGFDHPLVILYSSGTTGVPKCIVHRTGGILLTHLREHRLHCDVRPGDRVFYFTTAGWMMWNWLASALASEATLVIYDGSPAAPATDGTGGEVLFEMAETLGVTLFGTSAKFIESIATAGLTPSAHRDLSRIRTITSTGSPLAPEGFDAVAERISATAHLASISGGTDLCGCLVGGDPTRPVFRGEIQGPALGMDIAVLDPSGTPVTDTPGELTCATPFPSMPLGLWADDGSRMRSTWFERFEGRWHQGDYATAFSATGGLAIHGRSDATLNPGGVRIGSAEVTRLIDRMDEVVESLVIGQPAGADTRIVAFVILAEGVGLDEALVTRIRSEVRAGSTARHVPAVVVGVSDLPRTRSGKLAELAVRDVVTGQPVLNKAALANPECLTEFADRTELAL